MTPKSKLKSKPRDLFPGALEMMVLQTLSWQPMHGYALVQHLQQRSKNHLQVEEGSLYPALQRMLKEGLVEAAWKISPNKRRVRTYYITPRGAKHLQVEISRFDRMLKGMSLVLAPTPPTKPYVPSVEPA
jgi:PadR family transcriptional regulator PadR